jgi:catechol 2,3-dioxygenase-like lactoylglutathione lyase family enzyme
MRSGGISSVLRAWLIGFAAALGAAGTVAAAASSSSAPANGAAEVAGEAPATARFERVWHFGRVTGDLERIIAFYQDLLGLTLRGPRDSQLRFLRSPAIDEFVATPKGAQFRAVHLLIPGASHIADAAESISLEAFEFRGIDRRQVLPTLSRPGVSSLRFLVSDLEGIIAAAKVADVAFVTPAAASVTVSAPQGFAGKAKAVMVRDPDGYPVELMQLEPAALSFAPGGSKITGAMMVVVVADLDASLRFYHGFFGDGLRATEVGSWLKSDGTESLRGLGTIEHRSALLELPGSALRLELLQFGGAHLPIFRPMFQDIGPAHLALYTPDVPGVLAALRRLGGHTLSRTDTWTQFAPTLRGFYTRDPDGFFLEVIERH